MTTKASDFVLEYTIQHDASKGITFVASPQGISEMRLHPNAVVYTGVPLIKEGTSDTIATLDATLWEVDSSRDPVANHYGVLINYHADRALLSFGVNPYLKVGDEWILEPTTIAGQDTFVVIDFKPLANPFTLHAEGWKTYRASKNASLMEFVVDLGRRGRARSPKLALPYYKLQQAYRHSRLSNRAQVTYVNSLLAHLPNLKPALFGTSGVRGKLGYDIGEDTILATSQAIIEDIVASNLHGPIVIGCDTRFSSEDFAHTAAEVFAAHASELSPSGEYPPIIFMDIPLWVTDPQAGEGKYYKLDANGEVAVMRKPFVPTPLMTYAIRSLNPPAVAGVTMTASHNYGTDNGYKSLRGIKGGIAQEELTNRLQRRANQILSDGALIERYDFDQAVSDGLIGRRDLRAHYFAHIESLLPKHPDGKSGFAVIQASKPQVAVDLLYGTGNGFLDGILETIADGQWPIIQRKFHYWRDPSFGGGRPDCEDPENIRGLIDYVKSEAEAVDVGLSVDSDADRFGIVDRDAPIGLINANHILAMQLYYRNQVCGIKDPVCRTVVTTHMLDAMARAYGDKLLALPRIGFKWIGDRMNDEGMKFVVCGEESSGLSIGDFPEKDGILADILTLEMMCKLGQMEQSQAKRRRPVKPLSEILDELQQHFGAWHYHRRDLYGIKNKQKVMDYFRYFYRPETIGGLEMETPEVIRGMFSYYADDDPRRVTEENRAKLRDPRSPVTNDNLIPAGDNPLVGDGVKYYLKLRPEDYATHPNGPRWREDGIVGASVHIRESGNEPVIRVYSQHRTNDAIRQQIEDQIVQEILRVDTL